MSSGKHRKMVQLYAIYVSIFTWGSNYMNTRSNFHIPNSWLRFLDVPKYSHLKDCNFDKAECLRRIRSYTASIIPSDSADGFEQFANKSDVGLQCDCQPGCHEIVSWPLWIWVSSSDKLESLKRLILFLFMELGTYKHSIIINYENCFYRFTEIPATNATRKSPGSSNSNHHLRTVQYSLN